MTDNADEVRGRIDALRGRIDEVDCELVRLLNERASLALQIRELKPQVGRPLFDPKREEEIFAKVAECNDGPLYGDNLREIFEAVLHVMKEL